MLDCTRQSKRGRQKSEVVTVSCVLPHLSDSSNAPEVPCSRHSPALLPIKTPCLAFFDRPHQEEPSIGSAPPSAAVAPFTLSHH